jgi:site-specific recombinase XerD
MLGKLERAARVLGLEPEAIQWHNLRFEFVLAIRGAMIDHGFAPATINSTLSAVRGVANVSFDLGQMSASDLQRILKVKNVRGSRLPAGRVLSAEELSSVMDVCRRDRNRASGARDLCLLSLLQTCGLRRSEWTTLSLDDYKARPHSLKVRGKGRKERLVYVEDRAARAALRAWLVWREEWPGALFCPVKQDGQIERRGMSDQAIYNALLKRARQAGLRSVTPHDFRRTFITNLLDNGADPLLVAELAGHASLETTKIYDRRGEQAKRKASRLARLPKKK